MTYTLPKLQQKPLITCIGTIRPFHRAQMCEIGRTDRHGKVGYLFHPIYGEGKSLRAHV